MITLVRLCSCVFSVSLYLNIVIQEPYQEKLPIVFLPQDGYSLQRTLPETYNVSEYIYALYNNNLYIVYEIGEVYWGMVGVIN